MPPYRLVSNLCWYVLSVCWSTLECVDICPHTLYEGGDMRRRGGEGDEKQDGSKVCASDVLRQQIPTTPHQAFYQPKPEAIKTGVARLASGPLKQRVPDDNR